jgi:hemolysin III
MKDDRVWSAREEFTHALSHGLGAVAALIGGGFLIQSAWSSGRLSQLIGAIVFSVSAVALYAISSALHALPEGRTRDRVERLDHIAIYLLIAGTYTPFTLGILHGPWGWTLLILIWSMAILGIASKLWRGLGNTYFSTGLYVAMGWVIVIAARPLCERMPTAGLVLMLSGGLSYTIGVFFFLARRIPFSHLIWHLLVMGGTAFHYLAIRDYAG